MIDKFNSIKMRKIYVAWQAYNFVNRENARLLKRFLVYMMHNQMRRNLKRWSYNSKLKKEAVVVKNYEKLGS